MAVPRRAWLSVPGSAWCWGLLWLLAVAWLGYGVQQSAFWGIALGYGSAFVAYGRLAQSRRASFGFWLVLAVLGRALLVPAWPLLSDDLYRFIWDGRLLIHGYNPFAHLPSWYLEQDVSIPGIDQALFEQLNSPTYFTIYPPFAQGVFALACRLFPGSIWGGMVVMKLLLLAAEVGTLRLAWRLLHRWGIPHENLIWYALNPLVVVEVMGNLHFEGFMVFFLLLALWWLACRRWWAAAAALAASIASKLLPLMFLPFLIRRLGRRRSLWFFPVLGTLLLLAWLPLFSGSLPSNLGNSLNLYFRQFEFNASLYYLVRWVGYQQTGFNQIAHIGPVLALVVFGLIMIRAFLDGGKEWRELPGRWLFAITVYLLFATTVHPWYLCMPLALCIFTPVRFPVVWSALATLSYAHYAYEPFREHYWLIGLEYGLTFLFALWEWRRFQRPHEHVPLP